MKYAEVMGDCTVTFEGTPEEIAKLIYMRDNELIEAESEKTSVIDAKEWIERLQRMKK